MNMNKVGRNDPCPCGSGKKYKQCCQQRAEAAAHNPAPTTLLDALQAAVDLHQTGQLDRAASIYQQILQQIPNDPNALHLLGDIAMQKGEHAAAIDLISKAIRFNPDFPVAYYNLGNAYRAQGNLQEAAGSYRSALKLAPNYAEAHYNLGLTLYDQGMLDDAVASYRQAVQYKPNHAKAYHNLGVTLYDLDRIDEAIASFRQALEQDPKNESSAHLLNALTSGISERSPSDYVEKLFDSYADRFDSHLVQSLQYNNPAEIAALVKQAGDASPGKWDVLDLGCGTGLVGAEIASCARQLTGVDLSARMLAKAHARGVYDRLVKADLLPMMRIESAANYDVVIAADVFAYLGKLDDIVFEARRLLRPGGCFAFTVEAMEALAAHRKPHGSEAGYCLNPSGRYAHSSSYLEKLAADHGFKELGVTSVPLRIEKGVPLQAWMVLWQAM